MLTRASMNPKALFRLLLVASLTLLIFVAALLLAPKWRQMELMRQSEPIHEALKAYHQKYGGYPESLDQIGIPSQEEGPIYYQHEGSSYLLWFGTRLGESQTYRSHEGFWR